MTAATVLIPLPHHDFDPTESGVPWRTLTSAGHRVVFATPDGAPARADPRMLTGEGLGPWRSFLRADTRGREAYAAMARSPEFLAPERYGDVRLDAIDALVLPGGHAPGMKVYLESLVLQSLVSKAFEARLPVAAICHGVVLAARARRPDGRSVLWGRRTTALPRQMELTAWGLTAAWLGSYYRTYPRTVQDEVTGALASPADFDPGPMSLRRDSPSALSRGFVVQDGNYLSARWPGDAHAFASRFCTMLNERPLRPAPVNSDQATANASVA